MKLPLTTFHRHDLSLAEAQLLRLQSGVPKGRDDDESVAVPLRGLAEFQVERLASRGDRFAVGQDQLPAERPVARVTTVIQSPLPSWIGYGVYTCMSGKIRNICCITAAWATLP